VGARHDPAATVETISGGGRSFSLSWQAIKALDGSEPGAIGVATSTDSMEMAGAGVLISMIVTALIATLMAGAAGFFLGRSLGARVESLTEAATRMGVGELSGAIEDPSATRPGWLPSFIARDELSALSAQLDQMRESFRQAVDRLRKR
jgi:HAMP domain-containing protein